MQSLKICPIHKDNIYSIRYQKALEKNSQAHIPFPTIYSLLQITTLLNHY
jgi:hypothetical protein